VKRLFHQTAIFHTINSALSIRFQFGPAGGCVSNRRADPRVAEGIVEVSFATCISRLQIPDASYALFEMLIHKAMRYIIVHRTRRYDMKIGNKIGEFLQLRKAYRDLSRLDDSALKDIGVSRGDIKRLVYGR
jgi:uncharacterized protein YjiS (DUF1127 family)